MTAEGDFPKENGDAYFPSEVNAMIHTVHFSSFLVIAEESVSTGTATKTCTGAEVYYLRNTGAENVHLNFEAAATNNNFYLLPGEEIRINLDKDDVRYKTSQNTSKISILAGASPVNAFTNFESKKVSVGNTSTEITTTACKMAILINRGVQDVWINIGGAATTAKFRIAAGEKIEIDRYDSTGIVSLYGITAASTSDVCFLGLR